MREAPGVKQRRRDHRGLLGLERDPREHRRQRGERVGGAALRALRGPGRTGGQDHEPRRLLGRVEVGVAVGALDQLVDGGVATRAVLAPADEALQSLAGLAEQLGELLVVDQRRRLLALDHADQLRARERGVHVEAVGAELRDREGGVDEAAVVAAHDRDPVARFDALVGQRTREGVGAPLHLGEGHAAVLVDDHRAIGIVDHRACDPGRRRGPPAMQLAEHAHELVRAHRPQHPRLCQGGDVERHVRQRPEWADLETPGERAGRA